MNEVEERMMSFQELTRKFRVFKNHENVIVSLSLCLSIKRGIQGKQFVIELNTQWFTVVLNVEVRGNEITCTEWGWHDQRLLSLSIYHYPSIQTCDSWSSSFPSLVLIHLSLPVPSLHPSSQSNWSLIPFANTCHDFSIHLQRKREILDSLYSQFSFLTKTGEEASFFSPYLSPLSSPSWFSCQKDTEFCFFCNPEKRWILIIGSNIFVTQKWRSRGKSQHFVTGRYSSFLS